MRRRKSSGASLRQIHLRILAGAPGWARGWAGQADPGPRLANEVSRRGASRRSTISTSWPASQAYQAVAVPTTPAPRMRIFIEGSNYTLTLMRPRRYADLIAFVREACTHASKSEREISALPFYVKQHVVGWLRPSFAAELRRWPHVFEVHPSYVTLRAQPDTPQGRTAAMAEVTRDLERDGVIRGWRDETVSVAPHYASPELLRIERAATRHFGLMAYGAHLNRFTRIRGLTHLWIARRRPGKPIYPDRLDNLVGGRIAAGMSVDETLRKEAWEEAGIAPGLLGDLNCGGPGRGQYSVPQRLPPGDRFRTH